MNREILLELAESWEHVPDDIMAHSDDEQGRLRAAEYRGHQKALAACAEDLRTVVRLFCR